MTMTERLCAGDILIPYPPDPLAMLCQPGVGDLGGLLLKAQPVDQIPIHQVGLLEDMCGDITNDAGDGQRI